MSKYDIGLVGYWYATNYGSVITYYALSLALNKMGHTTVMIDRPEKERDPEGEDVISRNFLKRHCNISESVKWDDLNLLNDLCDTFVVGSDQVWTSSAIRYFKYMFFLSFVSDEKKKIAYAPSFGSLNFLNLDSRQETQVSDYLKRFDKISIREDSGAKMVRERFGINADRTLDPVFLITQEDYNAISEESDIITDGRYILAYILDPTPDKEGFIKKVADKTGMSVKLVLDGRKGTFSKNKEKLTIYGDESIIPDVNVEDWVKLFKNSEYVLTDSHHGLAMAVIYNKSFICYANRSRGYERFTSLLGLIGLTDRMVDNSEQVTDELMSAAVEYDDVNKKLAREKEISTEWLRDGITSVKKLTVRNIVEKNLCSGCGGCSELCPTEAINMVKNSEGFLNPEINIQKCTRCGLCFNRCPSNNPQYKNTKNPKCYAVMAHDNVRRISSSGGMFTIAAEYVLDLNGAVCGAAYKENFDVEHIIIRNKDELTKLRGSKYIQSNASVVYSKIKELLSDGVPVLFSGMPCQVAGLYSFLGKDYDNLYTMDLLCHGIAPYSVFEKYKKDTFGEKELVKLDFKAKEPWDWHAGINAHFSDSSKYSKIIEVDPYFVAYIQGFSKNITCGICRFNRLPRQGDLTIGDFWKIWEFDQTLNDNKGTSVVLVNNDKGEHFFEKIRQGIPTVKEAPLQTAISGNHCIEYPYRLNKNRDLFFKNLNTLPFDALVSGCKNNRLYEQTRIYLYSDVSDDDMEFYLIAQAAARNCKGRKIVTWIRSEKFERILNKYFKLSVAFGVSMTTTALRKDYVLDFSVLSGKSKEYYVVSFDRHYDEAAYQKLASFGYSEIKDFIFRIHKPVVLENFDLAKGNYYDEYGNSIEGYNSVIGKVILRGFNNHIILGNKISTAANLNIDLSSNCHIEIGDETRFNALNKFEVNCFDGRSTVIIGKKCNFRNVLWKLYNDENSPSVIINDFCTFETNIEFHANSGKKIIVGKDCMFSHNISLWAGDGHVIFDVRTQKKINSSNHNPPAQKNRIVLGNHVWVGTDAFIMHGTDIGNGSIIGAKSVVKGIFPNNCSVGGNPAKLIRSDIAWSREMYANSIERCGGPDIALTNNAKASISGLNVLVVGGTRFMGIQLVKELIALGNNVTIATRGNVRDGFGLRVNRLKMDVSNAESVKNALDGKQFDVVFDNLAYCSIYANNILSNVKCRKYIQLSSVEAYDKLSANMSEELFDPYALSVELCGMSAGYIKGKRQAEAIAYQNYPQFDIVTVRIPYVTKTDRLYYYCKSIVKQIPMDIRDTSHGFTFIRDTEVGKFLPWIAAQSFTGPINLASEGMVTIQMILDYIEGRVGKKAVIDTENGTKSPFHEFNENTFSQNMDKAKNMGYHTSEINDWFWRLMDEYIERALKENR